MIGVLSRCNEIMGLDLKQDRGRWIGRYYIDGSVHPYRRDKMKVVLWKNTGGSSVWVHEEGGESMSLVNWLQRYGGAADRSDALRIMKGLDKPKKDFVSSVILRNGKVSHVDMEDFLKYGAYDLGKCNLFAWLSVLFGRDSVVSAFRRYNVTTNADGDAVFWYMNADGKIAHDKVMRYLRNGHRDKSFGGFRVYKTADGYSDRCFFGSHLITDGEVVNVVESEKTCLLGYLYYGGVWISCGGKNNLKDVDSDMVLYPDMDAIEDWQQKSGATICEWWLDDTGTGDHDDVGDMIVRKVRKGEMFKPGYGAEMVI